MKDKNTKISDIAKKANVSTASVSRVINNKPGVSTNTRNKILSVINRMQYTPNFFAQNMRNNTSKLLGIVISDMANEFFKEVVRAIEDQAAKSDYKVIIMNSDEDTQSEIQAIHMLKAYSVSGFIIASTNTSLNYKSILGSIPVVFFDREPRSKMEAFDTLLVNNTDGAQMAVQELIRQGAKRVGMISSAVSTARLERLLGYRKALDSYKFPYNPELVKTCNLRTSDPACLAHKLLIDNKCDGIFAADNTLLKPTLETLKTTRITNLKIAVFDDSDWFDYFRQPVQSIKQPTKKIGEQAVNILLARINHSTDENPRVRRLSVQLIRR